MDEKNKQKSGVIHMSITVPERVAVLESQQKRHETDMSQLFTLVRKQADTVHELAVNQAKQKSFYLGATALMGAVGGVVTALVTWYLIISNSGVTG